MNRCAICGRKLKNSETTCGVEFCKVCEKYEQQLAEKDKEIEELKFEKRNSFGLIEKVSSKGQQEIRKEICEKIKNLIDICFDTIETTNENGTKYSKEFSFKKFNAIINAIEKGEQQ